MDGRKHREQDGRTRSNLPAIYGLKAMDSLQLAAALVWCKELPKNKDFVSADDRLLKAAERAGFNVHDLS